MPLASNLTLTQLERLLKIGVEAGNKLEVDSPKLVMPSSLSSRPQIKQANKPSNHKS